MNLLQQLLSEANEAPPELFVDNFRWVAISGLDADGKKWVKDFQNQASKKMKELGGKYNGYGYVFKTAEKADEARKLKDPIQAEYDEFRKTHDKPKGYNHVEEFFKQLKKSGNPSAK